MSKTKTKNKQYWKSDIVYYNKITKESGSLILDQSSALLEETLDTAKSIASKAEKIITIILPITSAILIYLIHAIPKEGLNLLTLSGIFAFMVLCISLTFSYLNFKHYHIYVPGIHPKTYLNSRFINTEYTPEEQYGNLVLVMGENIQDRIEENEILNFERTRNNRMALKWLFAIIFCPLLSFLVLLLYHQCRF